MNSSQVWLRGGILLVAISGIILGGCASGVPDPEASPAPTVKEPVVPILADAGIPTTTGEATAFTKEVKLAKFSHRKDPFALKGNEQSFEENQASLRVFNEVGGFSVHFTPPEEEEPAQQDIAQPQPYRRLAGVVVGDSVLALIDMGEGRPVEIIRPGQQIPNSEWTVASIDTEKAILTRKGNQTPRQVIVKLESPPPGATLGGAVGAPGGAPSFPPGFNGAGGAGGAGKGD